MRSRSPRRRRLASVVAVAVFGLLAAACGPSPENTGTEPATAGFPVTVTHAKGATEIPAKPQRVVALGYADIALARAMGAEIVGAIKYQQGTDGRNFPGVEPPLPPEVTTLDVVTPNLEQIVALQPDLLLATSAQPAYQDAYDKLSAIAPTVVYQTSLLRDPPEETTRLIGAALGEPDAAEQLLRESDRLLADFAAQRPYLAGRHYAFGQSMPSGLQLVVGEDAASTRLFGRIGLTAPAEFAGRTGPDDALGTLTLARENFGKLDAADVGFVYFYAPEVQQDPVFQNLEVVRQQRIAALSAEQVYAVLQPNPANTGYVLDQIAPVLEKLRG